MDWPELRHSVTQTADRVARVVERVPDPAAPVSGLDWTVADVAAHLVTVARRAAALATDSLEVPAGVAATPGGAQTLHRSALVTQANDDDLASLTERRPGQLAELLLLEVRRWSELAGDDGSRPVSFFGFHYPVSASAGILLGELLVHGLDIAQTVKTGWRIDPSEATAALEGLFAALPGFVNEQRSRNAAGTYEIRLRGGPTYTVEVEPGRLTVDRQRAKRADVHISADPVAYLLTAFGRRSEVRAALTGKVVAWGRRPWRVLRLKQAVDTV